MRAVVWVTERGWASAVDAARDVLDADAEVVLLHVTPAEIEDALMGPRRGLLGRRPPGEPPPGAPPPPDVLRREAEDVLADAAGRLGRAAERCARRGRVEQEVLAVAVGADLLVLARDGRPEPGPRSLAPPTRFVVDHAVSRVLLAAPS